MNERPQDADAPDARGTGVDRRTLLLWASGASLGATGFFLLATGVQTLLPPMRSIDGTTETGPLTVARLSDLALGVPQLVEYGDHKVFLIRTASSRVVGFDAACPHARCTLAFNEAANRFDCPCHGSAFTRSGERIRGPARRDMVGALVEVLADEVIVTGFMT